MTEQWPVWAALAVAFAVLVIAFMEAIGEDEAGKPPESSFDL
jgi:hypothetical protein